MRAVIVRPEAANDIRTAHAWYSEISAQFAATFIRRVDDAIERVRDWPLAYQVVRHTFRRVPLRRFPYALFYHADNDRVVIVAVLHQARDPQFIASRLDQST